MAKPNKLNLNGIRVAIDTLGCAKNQVDSRFMKRSLVNNGFSLTDDLSKCDCLILNTCSFIQAAVEEGINTFFEYKKSYPDIKIVVTGCMPSRYGKELSDALSEADAFVKCSDENSICDVLCELFDSSSQNTNICTIKPDTEIFENLPYAYVKISDGCNRRCSYCTIPDIRGKYKSASFNEICNDIDEVVFANSGNNMISEIVLVAQDCGAWGKDFDKKLNLAWLLDNLAIKYPQFLFRVLYIQPDAVTEQLLNTIQSHNNIANYFDVPIQHCCEHILSDMNRRGNAVKLLNMFKQIRESVPDAVLRTTLIAGFPGENEADFEQLCDFLEEANLDYCGVFGFSSEPGTKADLLKNKIDSDEIAKRVDIVRDICDRISTQRLEDRISDIYDITIEGFEEDRVFGRAYFQAPDVDGVVYVDVFDDGVADDMHDNLTEKYYIGRKLKVKIVDTEYYDLVGVEV